MDEQQPEQEAEKTKSKMHNEGSQKSQSQREGEEVTREKKKKKRKGKDQKVLCLEKCWKPEKVFTGNKTPPANQNQTRGHNECHAAIKQSMQSRTPSAITAPKKKGIYIYIYIYI